MFLPCHQKLSVLLTAFLLFTCTQCAWSQETRPIRIGVVTYLSGPGAGPMGLRTQRRRDHLRCLNAGTVPAPYQSKGFGNTPIEMVLIDEAGSTSNVVTQYRNLVTRQNVDMVIGYISSGSCLAVAPVAEELKILTVIDCAHLGYPKTRLTSTYSEPHRMRLWTASGRRNTCASACQTQHA